MGKNALTEINPPVVKHGAVQTMVDCPDVPEAVVFVDTNLGTHIAVPVSAQTTAKDFKRELEALHLNCFPQIGNIGVKGLMVKRNSFFYYLSDSLPLKHVFRGSNDPWYLHIDAVRIPCETNPFVSRSDELNYNFVDDTKDPVNYRKSVKCKRKKSKIHGWFSSRALLLKHFGHVSSFKRRRVRKREKNSSELENGRFADVAEMNYDEVRKSRAAADAHDETSLETVSISGIIKKYFSDYDEVASSPCTPFSAVRKNGPKLLNSVAYCKFSNGGSDLISPPTGLHVRRRVSCKPTSEPSIQNSKKPEVGRRILMASESLGLTQSSIRPVISLCKFSNSTSSGVVRNLVFELTEGD